MENNNSHEKRTVKKRNLKGNNASVDTRPTNNNEEIDDVQEKIIKESIKNDKSWRIFLLICIIGVTLGIVLEIVNVQRKPSTKDEQHRKYWVYSLKSDVNKRDGLLKHLHLVLDRVGYEKTTNETPWNLLWSHDYPFSSLFPHLHQLKPNQMVNKFPGTGYITNKVDLATWDAKYIPKAFKLPEKKAEFMKYVSENKDALFLEKNNNHRGIVLKNVTDIDTESGEKFVQECVQKPFLVDGHKFDIGVYVALTSVNPLRAYWYKGDVLFRYCPAKYYPLDPKNLDKYVVADAYLPTWDVPSLSHLNTALGFSMKDSFDIYVRSKGKDPSKMWEKVEKIIADVFISKEKHIIEALENYPSPDNFFELMRFDLVLDEDLNVYLLEANMSPNLSSHYPANQILYEQVLYSLFSLTGISGPTNGYTHPEPQERTAAQDMVSTHKNIAVWGNECAEECKEDCGALPMCALCRTCLTPALRANLLKSYREYLHRGDFRRLFPPAMKPNSMNKEELQNLTQINKLQYLWYQGKCDIDATWCT